MKKSIDDRLNNLKYIIAPNCYRYSASQGEFNEDLVGLLDSLVNIEKWLMSISP